MTLSNVHHLPQPKWFPVSLRHRTGPESLQKSISDLNKTTKTMNLQDKSNTSGPSVLLNQSHWITSNRSRTEVNAKNGCDEKLVKDLLTRGWPAGKLQIQPTGIGRVDLNVELWLNGTSEDFELSQKTNNFSPIIF